MSKNEKPRSIEEIIAAAKPRQTEVAVCLSGDLAATAERLEARLDEIGHGFVRSSLADVDPRAEIESELAEVADLMREAEVIFKFRALGKEAWSNLMAAHEPRKDKNELWNAETLPPALITACCYEPVMTLEQFAALSEVLNQRQRNDLWNAAYAAQVGETKVPTLRVASTSL